MNDSANSSEAVKTKEQPPNDTPRTTNLAKETTAIGAVGKALEGLDTETAIRVVTWAAQAVGASIHLPKRKTHSDVGMGGTAAEDASAAVAQFENFGEFFGTAKTETNADKALVAAYWFQKLQGQKSWTAQSVNGELKGTGYPISNITTALSELIATNPKLVIQLKKQGSSRQARKLYQITTAGLKRVETELLNSADE